MVLIVNMLFFVAMCVFFFFKQKTAYEMRISDWSSDVCSSDLQESAGRTAGWCWRGNGHELRGVGVGRIAHRLAARGDRGRSRRLSAWPRSQRRSDRKSVV